MRDDAFPPGHRTMGALKGVRLLPRERHMGAHWASCTSWLTDCGHFCRDSQPECCLCGKRGAWCPDCTYRKKVIRCD